MSKSLGTRAYLALALTFVFVALASVVVVLVNTSMRRLALTDAEHASRMLLDYNLAIHTYFSQDLKPKLFEQLGPITSRDYFEPTWMSSTYAVRKMDQYFRNFNDSPYYYKECAINARSPENEADEYEQQFFRDLQDNPQLTTRSAIREYDGQPFFTLLRRGEGMEKSCLRCHSLPELAPGDMVRMYGPERSFHRNEHDIVQAISIRIPLSEAFSGVADFSFRLSGLLLAALGAGFLFVWVGTKRLVVNPIAEIQEHAIRITSEHQHLGETIPEPRVRELRDLVAAFNRLSVELRKTSDEQEMRIARRTQELATERERLAITMRSIGDGVISTDTEGRVASLNRVAENLTGWTENEAVGRPLEGIFRIIDQETRRPCESPVRSVLRTGRLVGLANHSVLVARDGTERVLEDSGAPICSASGEVLGVVLVFKDVTEEARASKELSQREALLAAILAASPVGIVLTRESRIRWANAAWQEMFGFDKDDEYLDQPTGIMHPSPEDYEAVRKALYEDCLADQVSECEARLRKRDGTLMDCHIRARAVEASDLSKGTISAISDVTERRRVEAERRESESRFAAAFRNSPMAMAITSAEDDSYIDVNDVFLRDSEYTREEVIGSSSEELGIFVDRNARDRLIARVREQGNIYGAEVSFRTKSGAIKDCLVSTSVIRMDGRPCFLAAIMDVTENKRVAATERRLATAIEQATEGILITDIHGIIQYANPAIETISGYRREELIGNTPRILKSGEHDDVFYRNLWQTIRKGETWSGRFINRRKDGHKYFEDATISPVKSESGEIVNFVAVKRDITEHLELSRQLLQAQKMEAVGTLAGGVAHDFNNILQVALGYSEVLLDDEELPQRARNDLTKIHQSALRGAELVHRLLTFSRKTEINARPLNLNRRVIELRKMLERTIPKMIEIVLLLAEDLAAINADAVQVDQILMNLAVNARDAMPDGGKLIFQTENVFLDGEHAESHLHTAPGHYVLLTVSDTGMGMDKETVEHIFEPFYTTKESGKGTGLGLATVYGIVQQHHGHIRCYSSPNQGTSFKIYFPALVSERQETSQPSRVLPQGGSETILLVEDEYAIRDLGASILSRAGYKVISASDGCEALEIFRQRGSGINLVILDLMMPRMGGKQCLEELLQLNPAVKAVIASGYAADPATTAVISVGARGFIKKPFDRHQMLEVVREVLDSDAGSAD